MLRKINKRRRGANAMEFALTVPIFLTVTMSMIEFGWYFSRVALVNSAAMTGCREGGLIDVAVESPVTTAEASMDSVLASGGLSCTDCTAVISGAVPNQVLECSVSVDYDGLTGWLTSLGVLPNNVSTQTQVRLEWQRI